HMGDSALGTVRAFATNADAGRVETLVFTDIIGRALIGLPAWLGSALLAMSVLICAVYFWTRGREGRWRALASPLVAIIVAAFAAFLVGFAFHTLRPGMFWLGYPAATRAWIGLIALSAL